jgi:predicted RNase H-like HicB family nuclease
MYRVGFPGWKIAARFGAQMYIRVNVHFDPEVKSYWTSSPDLTGLVVTGNSLDELIREAKAGIDTLMEIELNGATVEAKPRLIFSDSAFCVA